MAKILNPESIFDDANLYKTIKGSIIGIIARYEFIKIISKCLIYFSTIQIQRTTNPNKTDNSAAEGIVTATVRPKISKAMDMRFYLMKDRVNQKYFFVYWKPGRQNMGYYFTKHHPPYHDK